MQTIFAKRASAVLHRFLTSRTPAKALLIPANVCPIVPATLMDANVEFELVDINPSTLCVDFELVLKIARERAASVAGLLYVHTMGFVDKRVETFFNMLREVAPDWLLIDDRCACWPAFEPSGTADLELYSTGYAKVVELGHGGYGFIRGEEIPRAVTSAYLEGACERLVNSFRESMANGSRLASIPLGWLDLREPETDFQDYKLEIKAKVSQVKYHKYRLNKAYKKLLPVDIQRADRFHDWRFNIIVPDKNQILASIFDAGLFASGHYASVSSIFGKEQCPVADQVHGQSVNLFNDHRFDTEKVESVCRIINQHLK